MTQKICIDPTSHKPILIGNKPVNNCGTNPCAPTGACCKPDNTCSSLTSAACTAAGGTYHGDGVSCGSITCPTLDAACGFCLSNNASDTLIATVAGLAGTDHCTVVGTPHNWNCSNFNATFTCIYDSCRVVDGSAGSWPDCPHATTLDYVRWMGFATIATGSLFCGSLSCTLTIELSHEAGNLYLYVEYNVNGLDIATGRLSLGAVTLPVSCLNVAGVVSLTQQCGSGTCDFSGCTVTIAPP